MTSAAKTMMFSFRLKSSAQAGHVLGLLREVGESCFDNEQVCSKELAAGPNKLLVFTTESGSHGTMQVYSSGLVTFDLQREITEQEENDHPLADDNMYMYNLKVKLPFDDVYIRTLKDKIEKKLLNVTDQVDCLLTPICRGSKVWRYNILGDCCLLERDFDEIVFDKSSTFQRVVIAHSGQHGNVLLLDGDVMIAESDTIYMETLLGLHRGEDYSNKDVLILGGGDGGILNYLLQRNPTFVTMAEIDEVVVHACRTHMRSLCSDSMDNYEGKNYQIRFEDCLDVMKESLNAGKKYDYVINDLTEFPVNMENRGFNYDFETTSVIMELSLKLIRPGGKLMMRGSEVRDKELVIENEKNMETLGAKYRKHVVHVPSYMGNYVFYEIWNS